MLTRRWYLIQSIVAQIYGLETVFDAREDIRMYDGNPVAAQIHIVKLKIATYSKLYS